MWNNSYEVDRFFNFINIPNRIRRHFDDQFNRQQYLINSSVPE